MEDELPPSRTMKVAYTEIGASISMEADLSRRFDLLMGVHPDEQRWLTEEEENSIFDAVYSSGPLALDWRQFFPEIESFRNPFQPNDLYTFLWREILASADISSLMYAFYGEVGSTGGYRISPAAAAKAFEENCSPGGSERQVSWSGLFPLHGPLGKVLEEMSGLTSTVKNRLPLCSVDPGLVANFLKAEGLTLEGFLDPLQFEDFLAALFAKEGWTVTQTPRTRDGGKDIIAAREEGGAPIVAYIEAKRQAAKVGISTVKEFVATVAGDEVSRGYLCSTSQFSRDAARWLGRSGCKLATVELLGPGELWAKMEALSRSSAIFPFGKHPERKPRGT